MTKTSRARILIVDDERLNINILGNLLLGDYEIKVATDGDQALQAASNIPKPDIILLDIMMPGMDGYEVCKRLKKNSDTKDIPIIFISAMSEESDEQKGLNLGAVDYITKPFSHAIVMTRIKNHLELKWQRDQLDRLATHDGLTGIPNRRRFDLFLDDEWRRAIRMDFPLSMIILDIDYFKQYNDHYGHVGGDSCLQQIAQVLSESLERATDLVARFGGEEFVYVLPNTTLMGAMKVAKKIRKNINLLAIPHAHSKIEPFVTVSLGVASAWPSVKKSAKTLIETTDKMLYQAKYEGRNRVVCRKDPSESNKPSDDQAVVISKAKIIIVDDSSANLHTLEAMLQDEYSIDLKTNGADALIEITSHLGTDLILMGIDMAGMDGYEVCNILKSDYRTRGIPIIFIDKLNKCADKSKGFEVGGADYITTPFLESEVMARVKTHLTIKSLEKRLEGRLCPQITLGDDDHNSP